jgi:hypothetical protein
VVGMLVWGWIDNVEEFEHRPEDQAEKERVADSELEIVRKDKRWRRTRCFRPVLRAP